MKELYTFVETSLLDYQRRASQIPLFQQAIQTQLTPTQQSEFVHVYYNIRGHFNRFMWYMGHITPDSTIKKLVCANIKEEFGDTMSHDQLYIDFGIDYGLNIHDEIIHEKHYLAFARHFDRVHLETLFQESFEFTWSAFSAYEALDNIDYQMTLDLVMNFSQKPRSVEFFVVHTRVKHFQSTVVQLKKIWKEDPEIVQRAFNFIFNHQLEMWQNFWNHLDSYSSQ
jgi:hypothetical protein